MTGILFNSDGGSGVLYHFEPPLTEEQLCNVVNQLAETQVEVFIQSVNHGNDLFLHPTLVAEVWDASKAVDGQFDNDNFRKWALNIQSLLDRGQDPLDLLSARTHELGLQFWTSMRMNDIHHDDVERWPSLRSAWQRENEHLMIGSGVPDRYVRSQRRNYSWAMNYAEPEVRDRKFALIEEMCTRYDLDGFEMDFLSHPLLFKKGQEEEGRDLLTEFVRRVRTRLDEISREKGTRLVLLARVLPNFAECEEVGMDVRRWIREGLVDLIQPQTRGYLDMNADITAFVEAASGTNVRIAGGLEHYVRDYGGSLTTRASIEMMRAAAGSFYEQGAACLYLFNFDCHARHFFHPIAPVETRMLREIGSPATLRNRDQHYFVTRDMNGLEPEQGGNMPLPVNLPESGSEKTFTFTIGADLEAELREDGRASITLALTFNGPPEGRVTVALNGQELSEPEESTHLFLSTLTFLNPPVQQGPNELRIALQQGRGLRVEGIEVKIHQEAN